MNALLSVAIPTEYSEILLLGLQVVLIGMLAVFSVLTIIWGCISLLSVALSKKKDDTKQPDVPHQPVAAAPAVTTNDDVIVAVIAAAIAAAEADSPNCKFRVVSFNRK